MSTSVQRFKSEFPHEARERLRQFIALCLCSWTIHLIGYCCLHFIDGQGESTVLESPTRLASAVGFVVWSISLFVLLVAGWREMLPRRRAMLGVFSLIPTATVVLSYAAYFIYLAAYHVLVAVLHVAPSVI